MLSAVEARKKGIRACMEKIGFDFCMEHKDNACTSYGENDGKMFCFVGISDEPDNLDEDVLILSSVKGFPYSASCNVDMTNGCIEFI